MLEINTMRYGTDVFGTTDDTGSSAPFQKQTLLISKTPLDCSTKSEVTNFIISGTQPTSTNRRIIFKIDNALKYFSGSELVDYPQAGNVDDILKYGNTPAQLTALTNISSFVGKKIYPYIALEAPSTAEDFPTIKISLSTKTSTDNLTRTVESIVYELSSTAQTVTEIVADTKITGSASVDIKVRLRNGETWTDYMTLENASDKLADAVQFKFVYKVSSTNDAACVNFISVSTASEQAKVSGDRADLYSIVADYEVPLQLCYAVVRHDALKDATIAAYANFMKENKRREFIQIGTASGARQELTLGVGGVADKNIIAASIELYADSNPITNFSYNSEVSSVVINAKKGTIISASYEYDHDEEVWRKMNLQSLQPYKDDDGTYMSRYIYQLPDEEATDKTISNVYIVMRKLSGKATQNLGKATGSKQLFCLAHNAVASSITFSEKVSFSYDEQSRILSVVAAKNTALNVSYRWTGVAPSIRSFAAGWTVS